MLGKIKSYSKIKGYGFLSAVGPDRANVPGDVFFNISEASFLDSEPKEGLLVAFDLGKDRIGRRCATRVRLPGTVGEPRPEPDRQDMRRRDAELVFKK